MKYRPLGGTGLSVSEIGFGCWGIGGVTAGATSYGVVDDKASLRALERAFDLGINFYDTSNLYGDGHSEELLGAAFAHRRDKVVIATKAGRSTYETEAYDPADVRRSVEGSLHRLRTDYVDVIEIHSPSSIDALAQTEAMSTLKALKREGKIRAVGISVKAPAEAIGAIEKLGAEVIQVNFNLVDQRASEGEVFTVAAARKVGVIARTPLCFGMLSGKVSPETVFDARDHRSVWPKEQIVRWIEASGMFVKAVAAAGKQTDAQVALRFCLSFPAVSSTIPGMLNAAEVEENAVASDLGPLCRDDLARIVDIYRNNDFFVRKR